ncbi:hypothetical protein KEM52_006495, partial [Ascosphaera acerosa]
MAWSLGALIRSLQTAQSLDEIIGPVDLLPRATGLLTALSNPRNISLLTGQLLAAPAVWSSPALDLAACRRIMAVFSSAAVYLVQREQDEKTEKEKGRNTVLSFGAPPPQPVRLVPAAATPQRVPREEWVAAVVGGLSKTTTTTAATTTTPAPPPAWRHLLVLGGLLVGMEGQARQGLTLSTRRRLARLLVEAANATSVAAGQTPPAAGGGAPHLLPAHVVAMVLTYTWDLLPDDERRRVDVNALLPVLLVAAYESDEGLEGGRFLALVARDVKIQPHDASQGQGQGHGQWRVRWPATCPSFEHVRIVSARPLVASLGPLSKLVAHCLETGRPDLAPRAVDALLGFSASLLAHWQQTPLAAHDDDALDADTSATTLPVLRQVLKMAFFSAVMALRAVLGRVLNDAALAADAVAPRLAANALRVLRGFCFVSALVPPSSQYTFVSLAAIDVLAQHPALAQHFLEEIRAPNLEKGGDACLPSTPLQRSLDLYFLNTAEHFSLALDPAVSERLLVAAALPYLAAHDVPARLVENFEAAHSVMLSVLAAPRSAEMAAKYLHVYVDNLNRVFPANLSARQFRLAYRTILQITATPSPLANTQPLLPSILLDMLEQRALHAPTHPLPPHITAPSDPSGGALTESAPPPPLSEQAVLALALIDCLCFLDVACLEEWLPRAARLVNVLPDEGMRTVCRERFWQALSEGEMD